MTGVPSLTSTIGFTQGILNTRAQITELQQALGSGFKSDSYAGLGSDRTLALSMKNRVAKLESYQSSIQTVQLRLDVMQLSVSRFNEIVDTAKFELRNGGFDFASSDQTLAQEYGRSFFNESVSVLNADVAGRFLFSGRAVDTRPVEAPDLILEGDGTRAGLETLANERKLADAGADGRGRLTLGATVDSITIDEDGDHPFGFKLGAITTDMNGAVVTTPGATQPRSGAVQLTAQPADGQEINIFLDLPDGTRERVTLTARSDLASVAGAGPGDFQIGPDVATTLGNLQTAMENAIEDRAYTHLQSASTVQASRDFFAADADNPPMRVDGPPFDTATGMVAGTADNTMIWYKGENGSLDARDTSVVRIDDNVSMAYGARAAEDAFNWGLAHMAAFAIESFDPANDQDQVRYQALQEKIGDGLYYEGGRQTVESVSASLVAVVGALGATDERHTQSIGLAQATLDDVLRTDNEETAVKILALQTRLQASYETTALLSQLSLVNYLR
jgi:flagellar hook-associated protein 3 FlgL